MASEEIQAGVTSARAAQRRSLETLDEDIQNARALVRAGKFKNDQEEANAHRALADLLDSRVYINRRIKE